MKQVLSVLLICFSLFMSGCDKEKPAIYFSSRPIEKQNFSPESMEKAFAPGQRVYFIVYYPKGFETQTIRLQIVSKKETAPFYGVGIEQVRDVKVKEGYQIFSDTFCLYRDGFYFLRVFSPKDWQKPLVQDYFWIKSKNI